METQWRGYVIFDSNRTIFAVYGDALMKEAFDKCEEIWKQFPFIGITCEHLEMERKPHVGNKINMEMVGKL